MLDIHSVDPARLEAFVARAIRDLTAGYTGIMVSLGTRLGLYRALAGAGPLSSREVALRSGCSERYVREWLNAQAAGGYLAFHRASETYELLPEQAAVLADEGSPHYIADGWNVPASLWADEEKLIAAFRDGSGIAWGDHDRRMHCGSAAIFRNAYNANLVRNWLPTLDGIVDRLSEGIVVADVGCGAGLATRIMAEAFLNSRFHGFDTHAASIAEAREYADVFGLSKRAEFSLSDAASYPDRQYDLICFFDVLHDLGDPVSAARHAAKVLAPGGAVMLIEPCAHDHTVDNLTPVGQLFYSASTVICSAHAISEGATTVLGAQAGGARLAQLFRRAGFTHFRRTAETPFNMIYEARR